MERESPLVSIIIAVWNGKETVGRCLDSVLEQSYTPRQLIILDAGSTDGTVDVLRAYSDRIAYWRSEPDKGIYDAWNKGLDVAKGDWICFIGADDYYADRDALAAMMEPTAVNGVEFVSARCAVLDDRGERQKDFGLKWDWQRERRRHYICHPGSLHHRSLFERYGRFATEYRIAADYDFNLRAGKELTAAFVDRVALCLGDRGVCRAQVSQVLREMHEIQRQHPDIGPASAWVTRLQLELETRVHALLARSGLASQARRLMLRIGVIKR